MSDIPTDDIILRTRGISMLFPGTVALDNVDYRVWRGKVNVIIGENGAGKSTLMKILAGVQQPSLGEMWLNGKQVYAGKPSNGPAAPDQVSVEVALKAGMNRLLFEVSYQGSNEVLYARLLDPQRKLTYPEPAEK